MVHHQCVIHDNIVVPIWCSIIATFSCHSLLLNAMFGHFSTANKHAFVRCYVARKQTNAILSWALVFRYPISNHLIVKYCDWFLAYLTLLLVCSVENQVASASIHIQCWRNAWLNQNQVCRCQVSDFPIWILQWKEYMRKHVPHPKQINTMGEVENDMRVQARMSTRVMARVVEFNNESQFISLAQISWPNICFVRGIFSLICMEIRFRVHNF